MTELANDYRSWIASRSAMLRHVLPGCSVDIPDDEHVSIVTEKAIGHVNFYVLDEGAPEIVELNIVPADDPDNPSFFLHFEMDDAEHARQLFDELVDTLAQANSQRTTKVLLTCTSALTTSFFAKKLSEVAATLSLDFEFEALPITKALEEAGNYTAVMLAPQVHMHRAEMVELHPDLVVFEIPGTVFGSYDAGTALRMLLNAMQENALAARMEQRTTRIVRKMDNDKRILVISGVYGPKDSVYDYRVYDSGEVVLEGRVEKRGRDYRDVKDILAGVRLRGIDPAELDAIGIALPGIVDEGHVSMIDHSFSGKDFSALGEKYGIPVLVDNNANAAAVGCYVSQDESENITLHRQPTGYVVGGQGLIVDGRLVRGAHGLAGELGYFVRRLGLREDLRSKAWTSEGMRELVATYLLCNIAIASPEVIYVAVDLLPEMDDLRSLLADALPEGTAPKLVAVCDYHDRVLVGEYALCLNALRQAEAAEE